MHPVPLQGRAPVVFGARRRDAKVRADIGLPTSKAAGGAQTPVTQADGSSECPGDSSHERVDAGVSSHPWDIQQADKSIRVRNAGESLLPWRSGSSQLSA